jgi:hypothetical protein
MKQKNGIKFSSPYKDKLPHKAIGLGNLTLGFSFFHKI